MPEWPMYVYSAAYAMGYQEDEPEGQAAVEAFAARWGGFGPDALVRAMREAEGEEWRFGMELLIDSAAPQAREQAATGLTSTDRQRRWYSALYLGVLQDRRAVPALSEMLTEILPAPDEYQQVRIQQWWYEDARRSAAYLLGKLRDPTCVPALRRALQAVVRIEQAQSPPPTTAPAPDRWTYDNALHILHSYQDGLVYSLGRLRALGALTGLQGGADHLDIWRVHLLMGSIHGRYRVANLVWFEDEPALEERLNQLLARIFGLSPSEQAEHLKRYEAILLSSLSSSYDAEELAQRQQLPT